jgi:hypothetical protein
MTQKLEYDFPMQRLNRATGLAFALALFLAGPRLTPSAGAQVNGMPASVTSPGFGGRQVNGVAPSVTSLGPRGYTPNSPTCCFRGVTPPTAPPNPNGHPHHNGDQHWGLGYYGYGVPYYGYYDSGSDPSAAQPPDDQYNGGPTIFDRRGPGSAPAPPSAPYARNRPQPDPPSDAQAEEPAADQPQTVLVFKDGHQLEVANYAIVGNMLYDLTGGHRQKIALADLDLTATSKQNDDRGIDFEVPSTTAQAN